MNNKLPIIKDQNNYSLYDKTDSKSKIMTSMTQEIMTNFKKKISSLELENKKISDDLLAVTRNFEALSIKHQEDLNLIKRLQSELSKVKSKNEINDINIKDDMLKSLQIKNEDLIYQIQQIESQSKIEIKKLIDEIKNLKKQNEEIHKTMQIASTKENSDINKYKNLCDEQEKIINELKNENSKLGNEFQKEKNLNKDLINMNDRLVKEKEKLIKENKLMYKTIEETREKLNNEMKKENELQRLLHTKPKQDIETENKLNQALKEIEGLYDKIDTLKQENTFNELNNKNLMDEIARLKNKKPLMIICNREIMFTLIKTKKKKQIKVYEKESVNSFDIMHQKQKKYYFIQEQYTYSFFPVIHLKFGQQKNEISNNQISLYYPPSVSQISLKLISLKSNIKKALSQEINDILDSINKSFETKINDKIDKMNFKLNKLKNVFEGSISSAFENFEKIKRESNYIKQKQIIEIKKLKDEYEEKLTKKRNKKFSLKNEINDLLKQIDTLNKTKVDLTEIHNLFNQVSEIVNRLKLTMDTLQNSVTCKNCNSLNKKMYILECGHSLCKDCILNHSISTCVECQSQFSQYNHTENVSLNNLNSRYIYAKQQVESDLNLVLTTIKGYLNK